MVFASTHTHAPLFSTKVKVSPSNVGQGAAVTPPTLRISPQWELTLLEVVGFGVGLCLGAFIRDRVALFLNPAQGHRAKEQRERPHAHQFGYRTSPGGCLWFRESNCIVAGAKASAGMADELRLRSSFLEAGLSR
jgi:hypothetical protein